ncbi:ubiquitin carboxyl-terminal hydrolase 16-like [Ylistrum balloti]|uniref:ubiquitin carboxyl-terminal hydrolase 16-like n=1 Tax=Ylistrum balloti TaxID=509963 RepID=UPI002905E2BB|nr:ubiquitin carboxyl-terminal hydrolase 16-like [Ylistrum balloti]
MEVDSADDQAIRTGTMYSTAEKMEMMNKGTNVRSTCEGTTDIADLRLESPGNERYNQLQGVFPEHSCEEKQLKIIPHQPLEMMRKDPTDLERGLHELTEEEIWDEEVIGCRICHSPTARGKKTHKKLMIIGLPPIFVAHINKIEKDGFGGLRKIDKMVTYPKYLNVAPFCSSALQKYESGNTTLTWFKLFGVVSHSGSIYGGHYTAYVRTSSQNASAIRESFLLTAWIDPERIEDDIRKFWEDSSHRCNMSPSEPPQNTIDEEWYYVSDTMVQKCTERAATLDRNAFILMYERCC